MLYDRKQIKAFARDRLNQNYWMCVLVLFLFGLLCGGSMSTVSLGGNSLSINFGGNDTHAGVPEEDRAAFLLGMMIVLFVLMVALVLSTAYVLFVGNVIATGVQHWLYRVWLGEKPPVGDIFRGFRHYGSVVGARALRFLYVFLWSLLFIVPGVVKSYSYSMVGFLIAENPDLTPRQALRMSRVMTDGYKGKLFVQDLSFFGWSFLSLFTCGLLNLFYVAPYQSLATAGAYVTLKQQAILSGRLTWADFGQQPPCEQA